VAYQSRTPESSSLSSSDASHAVWVRSNNLRTTLAFVSINLIDFMRN